MDAYAEKFADYFTNPRRDIESLLPDRVGSVLEIGCGTGETLRWLKQAKGCGFAVGVELHEAAAIQARNWADEVIQGNAEGLDLALFEERFDVVLCLDVLEHMIDPWRFVATVQRTLKRGGRLVASIPNLQHLSVTLPLLLGGRFEYRQAGILDRTHLRFFTRRSAKALLSPPGLRVTACISRPAPLLSLNTLFTVLTLGMLRNLSTLQYLVAAERTS